MSSMPCCTMDGRDLCVGRLVSACGVQIGCRVGIGSGICGWVHDVVRELLSQKCFSCSTSYVEMEEYTATLLGCSIYFRLSSSSGVRVVSCKAWMPPSWANSSFMSELIMR